MARKGSKRRYMALEDKSKLGSLWSAIFYEEEQWIEIETELRCDEIVKE